MDLNAFYEAEFDQHQSALDTTREALMEPFSRLISICAEAIRTGNKLVLFGNGGSAAEGPATLDKLLALDFDTVIPGHGPILTKDEVRTFRRNLQTVLDRVQGQIEAGATRDNIASRIDTNDLGWPLAPVRLQDVYDELTAAR